MFQVRRFWSACAAAVIVGWVIGCQMTPAPGLVTCPLPSTEQVHSILEIAPLGTSRDDTIAQLEKAGIRGWFGENQSIYYCDIWDRGEGIRWHINVALLFDDSGQLYATRPDRSGNIDPTPRQSSENASSAAAAPIDPFE